MNAVQSLEQPGLGKSRCLLSKSRPDLSAGRGGQTQALLQHLLDSFCLFWGSRLGPAQQSLKHQLLHPGHMTDQISQCGFHHGRIHHSQISPQTGFTVINVCRPPLLNTTLNATPPPQIANPPPPPPTPPHSFPLPMTPPRA